MKKFIALILAMLLACAPAAMAAAVDTEEFHITFEGNCHVRTGPGLNYDKLGFYNKGETVDFLEECQIDERDVRWYLVAFEEGTGWVSSKYAVITNGKLDHVSYCAESEYADYFEAAETTNLVQEPSGDAAILNTLNEGDQAENLGYFYFDKDGESWAYVSFGGETGWMQNATAIGVFE